jgi:D-glycero-D-manno-heptose 1,7-bisphosphate phosphatase
MSSAESPNVTRSTARPRAAVFLDRDGTINVDSGYVWHPRDLVLIAGSAAAIRRLNLADYLVIVVTNQSGVARGYFDEAAIHRFHQALSAQLAVAGARIDRFYFCPFHPTCGQGLHRRSSRLRKPEIGMFELATRDFSISVSRSWMVGDQAVDMEFARRSGLRRILVTGDRKLSAEERALPDVIFEPSLAKAVDRILRGRGAGSVETS